MHNSTVQIEIAQLIYIYITLCLLIIAGVGKDAVLEGFTNEFVLEKASASTIPLAIDDPSETPYCNLNELIVDLYNQGQSGTMRRGSRYCVH